MSAGTARRRVVPRVATAALVLGLVSVPLAYLLVGGVIGVAAILLGIAGVRRADATDGAGKGRSITGIVAGVLALIVAARLVAALTAPIGPDQPSPPVPAAPVADPAGA